MPLSNSVLRRFSAREGRGSFTIFMPAAPIVVSRIDGFIFNELATPYLEVLDGLLAKGVRPRIFTDCMRMTGYDGAVRERLTRWTKEHPEVPPPTLCVKSALIVLGVKMANAVLSRPVGIGSDPGAYYDGIRALLPPQHHAALARFANRDDQGFEVRDEQLQQVA